MSEVPRVIYQGERFRIVQTEASWSLDQRDGVDSLRVERWKRIAWTFRSPIEARPDVLHALLFDLATFIEQFTSEPS